tara:strand:+ start:5079 stop:6422 length:1344 start_codon:yes stop_codon:yes gene_type:complete
MSIIENIYTNVLFNELSKNNFKVKNFKKKNINIFNGTGDLSNDGKIIFNPLVDFMHNLKYMRLTRASTRMKDGHHFYYISPTDSNNKLKLKFPVNIGASYKLIFFCSTWDSENVETFNIVNGCEIISLKSQINNIYTNYITCTIKKSNVKNIKLIVSFKNKQMKTFANGLYLLNKYFIYNTDNVLYKNAITKKENELKLYTDENKKTYDMVICIAIWNRHEILKKIINLINSYNLPFSVGFILIYSKQSDYNLFPQNTNVHFIYSPNKPLGSKWQTGVYSSHLFEPKTLMILGSDDMVSKLYMQEAYNSIVNDNFDFCYNKSWLTYNSNNCFLYHQSYKNNSKILGAGRVFSSKLLKKLNYKIYDPVINKGLDNTFRLINMHYRFKNYEIENPGVLLYKGKWECISNLETLLTVLPTKLLNIKSPIVQQIYKNFDLHLPAPLMVLQF